MDRTYTALNSVSIEEAYLACRSRYEDLTRGRKASRRQEVGARVIALRVADGFTQETLAKKARLGGHGSVGQIERGEHFPSVESALGLACAFGVSVEELFGPLSSTT